MEKIIESPAKVNFILKVTGERPDGYHEIESLVQMISLSDTITYTTNRSGKISFRCDNKSLPIDSANLAVKAAETLKSFAKGDDGVDISLQKAIPVGAGLGGGSSNAATTLIALNEMWDVGLTADQLNETGLKLGADVPFFLGSALAWVEGIGEKIKPLSPKKALPLLLFNPGFEISAALAYKESEYDFAPVENKPDCVNDVESGEPERLARLFHNDLEPWALKKYPILESLKSKIERASPSPLGVVMSGSGPTLIALYSTAYHCEEAGKNLKPLAPFVAMPQTKI